MKIFPIKSYKNPRYPRKELFVRKPGLLEKFAPVSWKTKAAVAGALVAFVMGGCGGNSLTVKDGKAGQVQRAELRDNSSSMGTKSPVSENATSPGNDDKQRGIIKNENKQYNINYENKIDKSAKIAPIFEYGIGVGARGCVMIAPPVFMSEDDARRVIEDEFRKQNIIISKRNILYSNEKVDTMNYYDREKPTDSRKFLLELDGYSDNAKLGYQFVSFQDFLKSHSSFGGTVVHYDIKKTAEYFRDEMWKRRKMNAAVFYDPVHYAYYSDSESYEVTDKKTVDESKELLRKQVRDFLEWAKYEGVLDKIRNKKEKIK